MKPVNKFKVVTQKEESYKEAKNAFGTTVIVLFITFIISLLDEKLALAFILFYLVFTVSLIRWTQQANK